MVVEERKCEGAINNKIARSSHHTTASLPSTQPTSQQSSPHLTAPLENQLPTVDPHQQPSSTLHPLLFQHTMKSITIFALVCGLALSTLGAPFNRQQADVDGSNDASRGGGKNKDKVGAMQDKWAWKMGGEVDATGGEAQAGVDQRPNRPERPERPEGGTGAGKAAFMVVTCTTDADCNTDDGEACMSAKPRRFGQKNKGGGGAAADADVDSVVADEEEEKEREQRLVCKVPPTECTTDDDCAELEGTSCVARPQKEGATKEAKFFCRDPDAIRPSKGKGKDRSKGKGNGNGGNKAVVDGSD